MRDDLLPINPSNYRRVTNWTCPRCQWMGGAVFGEKVPEGMAKTQILRHHYAEAHADEYPPGLLEQITICEHTQAPWMPDCGCNPTRSLLRHMTKQRPRSEHVWGDEVWDGQED